MKPVGSKFWSLAIAVFTLLSVVSADAAMKANRAVVRAVRGTAEYSSDGNSWKKLSVGTQLNEKARIKTAPASTVDLFLGANGPVVRVTEDTILGLDKLQYENTGEDAVIETQLDLSNGRILGNVKKLAAASKYEVKTPQGVAGIRGTKYDISATGRVTVVEGSVMVVYLVNGQLTPPVIVNAGQTVVPPATAVQPVPLPAAPALLSSLNNEIDSIPVVVITGPGTAVIAAPTEVEETENFEQGAQTEAERAEDIVKAVSEAIKDGRLTKESAKEVIKQTGVSDDTATKLADAADKVADGGNLKDILDKVKEDIQKEIPAS